MAEPIVVNESVTVPAAAIEMAVARSGGPGGQNVNKVSSKVDLRVDLNEIIGLSAEARGRLRRLAGRRLDAGGRLQVVSQATRDQKQNLEDARAKVAALVAQSLVAPKPRKKTRPSRGSIERRLDEKRRKAERKQGRSGKW